MTAEDLKIIREVILIALDQTAIRDDNRDEFTHLMRLTTNDIHTYEIVKDKIYSRGERR